MKCVILAAGVSSRLYPLTASIPKCLLEVGKYTILERTIRNVLLQGIDRFVIVTGFGADAIRLFIASAFPRLKIEFIHNERFTETNNEVSLALASQAFQGQEILLLDSDIVFDPRLLGKLFASGYENCLVVRTTGDFDEEEILVSVDENGKVRKIGKRRKSEDVLGESIGMEKLSSICAAQLSKILRRRVFHEKIENDYYEASFQDLIDSGTDLYAVDAADYLCVEIDSQEDLKIARETIAPKLDQA